MAAIAREAAKESERRAPIVDLPPRDWIRAPFRMATESRLLHFFIIGAIIFALGPKAPSAASHRIDVTSRYLASLRAAQAQRLRVAELSKTAALEVDRRAIEDEVLYREALRLGLDKDDALVRQHLVQKVLLLAEDLGGGGQTPTEPELRAFYQTTKSRWTKGDTLHFVHVFSATREGALSIRSAVLDADALDSSSPPPLGDALSIPRDVHAGRATVAAEYGDSFADAIFAAPLHTWSEPIESKLGFHLVKVLTHEGGGIATFEEARSALMLEFVIDRRKRAVDDFMRRAFARYEVTLDGKTLEGYSPVGRLGLRTEPSEED